MREESIAIACTSDFRFHPLYWFPRAIKLHLCFSRPMLASPVMIAVCAAITTLFPHVEVCRSHINRVIFTFTHDSCETRLCLADKDLELRKMSAGSFKDCRDISTTSTTNLASARAVSSGIFKRIEAHIDFRMRTTLCFQPRRVTILKAVMREIMWARLVVSRIDRRLWITCCL